MRLITLLQRSLTAKLLVAFATVIVVGIAIVAVVANQRTTTEFDTYLSMGQRMVAPQLADAVAQTYRQTGSWDAVAGVLDGWSSGPVGRAVVANRAGTVVADSAKLWVGRTAASLALRAGSPIVVQGRVIGTLYVMPGWGGGPPSSALGMPMSPSGGPGAVAQQHLSQAEGAFLDRVNRSLIIGAIAAGLVALLIGILLARRIARPLGELTRAAQRIARGSYGERIQVGGADEVGRLAHAFNQMAESLARTEEARRQLVADVAHELRTPLTVLRGTVQAMRDGVLGADEQNLNTVQEEVSTLARLVTDLHDLSLGDVGQFLLQHEPLALGPVIEQTVAAFGAAATDQQVRLVTDVAPDLPIVQGDDDRLRQALRNLIANALRYTPPGGHVALQARTVDGAVEVQIHDTGEGIGLEHLPHVFERFYRADPSRTRRSGGSGLGLAIVRQIVRAHGGEITVASDGLGRGTTFTLRLPIAVADAQDRSVHAGTGSR